jgi:5-methylcytosine-specific restriction endonuclease McrA
MVSTGCLHEDHSMIDRSQVTARARQLYSDLKKRSAPTYWKNGKRKGMVHWEGVPIDYSSDAFASWLLTTIGCQAFLCPYCNAPLDALSMTLDHGIPLHSGGTNSWANLVPCCGDCNNIKGELTGEQYLLFRKLMRQMHPAAEANILMRVRSGGGAQKNAQRVIILQAELAKLSGGRKPFRRPSPVEEPF